MQMNIEYTDTFAGEANYSWVRRATIDVPEHASDYLVVRRAKAALGLTDTRFRKVSHNPDCIELREVGACCVLFITADYV